jgi:hypothetical protein
MIAFLRCTVAAPMFLSPTFAQGQSVPSRPRHHQGDRAAGRAGQARCYRLRPIVDTPAEFSARIRSDVSKWTKVIRDAHIEVQ